jgi:hypothetical protein
VRRALAPLVARVGGASLSGGTQAAFSTQWPPRWGRQRVASRQ